MPALRTPGSPGSSPWQTGSSSGRRSKAAWPEIGEAGDMAPAAAAAPAAPVEPEPPAPLLFDEADLARATAAVASEIRSNEQQAAACRDAERLAAALEAVAGQLTAADALIALRTRQFREAAAALAALATAAVGRAGGGKVAARLADALVTDCLSRFDPSLALAIEVSPEIADSLAATLEATPALRNRPGRIAVEAVATLAPGEARVIWADGEADWSIQRLHDDAAGLIRRLTDHDPRCGDQPSWTHPSNPFQGAEAR